ncbi:hypothetical protein Tco_0520353 [Tanacetum coccineum]
MITRFQSSQILDDSSYNTTKGPRPSHRSIINVPAYDGAESCPTLYRIKFQAHSMLDDEIVLADQPYAEDASPTAQSPD